MTSISPIKFTGFTFLFSWVLWGIAIMLGEPCTSFPTVLFYVLGGCGPSIVAIILVFRMQKKPARTEFWRRTFSFRSVQPLWWLMIILGMPAFMLSGVWLSGVFGVTDAGWSGWETLRLQPALLPMFLIMKMIGGPLAEELGWRGILLENLQQKWSARKSTIIVGLVWWLWHLPLFFIIGTTHKEWGLFSVQSALFALTAFLLTIMMTLSYNANRRSIWSAVWIHFMYNTMVGLMIPLGANAFFGVTIAFLSFVTMLVLLRKQKGLVAVPSD